MPARRNFKVTVLLAGRQKVQDHFHANESGARLRMGAREPGGTMEMVAFASRSKRNPLCAAHEFDRSATRCTIRARHFAFQADARWSVLQDGITPGCQGSILFKPQFLVILESLIRGKEQETKSISGPAIVAQKALQPVFLAAHLIVAGGQLSRPGGRGFAHAALIV